MSAYGVVAGLNRKAARLTRGAISLSSSSHLPVIVGSIIVKPVALPPGRARLFTKPLPTGSATTTKTTGIVRVCCSIDAVGGVFCVTMRSGFSAMSSIADRCLISASSSAPQRKSSWILRPSVHPSFWSPSRNAAHVSLKFRVALGMRHQYADAPHPLGLLRMRREWPRRRRRRRT